MVRPIWMGTMRNRRLGGGGERGGGTAPASEEPPAVVSGFICCLSTHSSRLRGVCFHACVRVCLSCGCVSDKGRVVCVCVAKKWVELNAHSRTHARVRAGVRAMDSIVEAYATTQEKCRKLICPFMPEIRFRFFEDPECFVFSILQTDERTAEKAFFSSGTKSMNPCPPSPSPPPATKTGPLRAKSRPGRSPPPPARRDRPDNGP